MFVRIHFPTVIDGLGRVVPNQIVALKGSEAIKLIKSGAASPDPELDELKRRAREQGQNVDWAEQEPFKSMRPRTIVAAATEEPFAKKVADATKARAARSPYTRKAHEEYVERESARWRKPERRPRTKSD
jgi:hypothetical protein